jgi:hypothetical protein
VWLSEVKTEAFDADVKGGDRGTIVSNRYIRWRMRWTT